MLAQYAKSPVFKQGNNISIFPRCKGIIPIKGPQGQHEDFKYNIQCTQNIQYEYDSFNMNHLLLLIGRGQIRFF